MYITNIEFLHKTPLHEFFIGSLHGEPVYLKMIRTQVEQHQQREIGYHKLGEDSGSYIFTETGMSLPCVIASAAGV